jgi:O-antigen ligase
VRYSAYAFLLTMPWAAIFAEQLNPHDVARMLGSVVMVFAAWAWWQRNVAWTAQPRWQQFGLATLAALAAASTAAAARPSYAALEVTAMLLLWMIALAFGRTPLSTLRRELPPTIALAGLVSVAMELPRWVFILVDGRVPTAMDFGFMYMNPRFYNHAQSVMLPMLLLGLLLPAARWVHVASWIGLCGGLALLWRMGGRGSLLALGTVAVLLPWMLRSQSARVYSMWAKAALGALAAYALLFLVPQWVMGAPISAADSAGARLAEFTDSGRLPLWQRAVDGVRQHPWLGVGPMHFAHGADPVSAHPHNSVLQLAMEWGLPAASLVLAAAGIVAWRSVQRLAAAGEGEHRTLLVIAALATVAGCIDSMVSGTLVMPVSQIWWCVALGVLLAAQPMPLVLARGFGGWRAAAAVMLVLAHVGLSAITYSRTQQPQPEGAALKRNNVPRYWIDGFF